MIRIGWDLGQDDGLLADQCHGHFRIVGEDQDYGMLWIKIIECLSPGRSYGTVMVSIRNRIKIRIIRIRLESKSGSALLEFVQKELLFKEFENISIEIRMK